MWPSRVLRQRAGRLRREVAEPAPRLELHGQSARTRTRSRRQGAVARANPSAAEEEANLSGASHRQESSKEVVPANGNGSIATSIAPMAWLPEASGVRSPGGSQGERRNRGRRCRRPATTRPPAPARDRRARRQPRSPPPPKAARSAGRTARRQRSPRSPPSASAPAVSACAWRRGLRHRGSRKQSVRLLVARLSCRRSAGAERKSSAAVPLGVDARRGVGLPPAVVVLARSAQQELAPRMQNKLLETKQPQHVGRQAGVVRLGHEPATLSCRGDDHSGCSTVPSTLPRLPRGEAIQRPSRPERRCAGR